MKAAAPEVSEIGQTRVPANAGAGEFLTTPEAAARLRVSKSYLDKLRVYGGGPPFIRLTRRKILYRRSALDDWAMSRSFSSTSQYGQ